MPNNRDRIFNIVPSRNTEEDPSVKNAEEDQVMPVGVVLPKKIDLRRDWWTIGNQGNTGSCVGWATADSLLRYHFVKAKKIRSSERMSVRYIWMAAKEMDEYVDFPSTFLEDSGTSIKTALKTVKKYGSLKASDLPFSGKMVTIKEKNFLQIAGKLKISAWYNLIKNEADKLESFKRWLHCSGPILTSLNCDKSWFDVKKDGLLENYIKDPNNPGHAMSIVGYTPTHFIIRNSWGTGWGDKGFAYASYDYARDAFKEAYGVFVGEKPRAELQGYITMLKK